MKKTNVGVKIAKISEQIIPPMNALCHGGRVVLEVVEYFTVIVKNILETY